MSNRERNTDWTEQVPETRWEGPYRDYGWESGESGLPEFRDPSIHLTPWERREVMMERRRQEMLSRRNPFRRGRGPQRGYFGEEYGQQYSPKGYYVDVQGRGFNDEGYFNTSWGWREPGPYTGVGPKNYRRSDERIWEDVSERLTQHGLVDASEIEVDVDDGEVTLNGYVYDRRQKRMAEDAVLSIPGVFDVHNRLKLYQYPRGGKGQREHVEGSHVYPMSDVDEAPEDSEVESMTEWGTAEGQNQAAEE